MDSMYESFKLHVRAAVAPFNCVGARTIQANVLYPGVRTIQANVLYPSACTIQVRIAL